MEAPLHMGRGSGSVDGVGTHSRNPATDTMQERLVSELTKESPEAFPEQLRQLVSPAVSIHRRVPRSSNEEAQPPPGPHSVPSFSVQVVDVGQRTCLPIMACRSKGISPHSTAVSKCSELPATDPRRKHKHPV